MPPKTRWPCQQASIFLRPLCRYVNPTENIKLHPSGSHTFKNTSVPCGYRGQTLKLRVFRDLGPKPPIPLVFGSPSRATAAQCAEEGGSAGQAGRMTGRSFSNGRLHKACNASKSSQRTHRALAKSPEVWAEIIPRAVRT